MFGIGSLSNPVLWLRGHIDQLIKHRLKNNVNRKDYMQILLEAQSNVVDTTNDTANQDLNQAKLEKKMTLEVSNEMSDHVRSSLGFICL